jgi:hypothetical protein
MREYDQDSILYVDNERNSFLYYLSGVNESIGVFKESPNSTDYYTELNNKRYSAE